MSKEMETCERCAGTGIDGHPDSGWLCLMCGGSGGAAAEPTDDLAARIAELEAEIEKLSGKALAWQPIETAPKDGTVVLVWHVTRINPYAGFDSNVKKGRYLADLGEWQVEGVGGNVPPQVTHWMPLPANPEQGNE